MRIVREDSFRSIGRRITSDDDMCRVTLDVRKLDELPKLKRFVAECNEDALEGNKMKFVSQAQRTVSKKG